MQKAAGNDKVDQRKRLKHVRLNRTMTPLSYNIELKPWIYNVSNARLDGRVEIRMRCQELIDMIVLNANNITIDQSSIELRENDANGRQIRVTRLEEDEVRQFITLHTQSNLVPSRIYYLKMKYNGTLLHPLKGFYRAMYKYQGNPRYIAVTQFEEADARRAFPCFDEPAFKATFTITLVRKPDYVALGNMELDRSESRDGGRWIADTFKETPVMSTYLVAFFVGQYVKKERTTPNGTLVRIWTQPNYIDYADFALSVSGELIEAFEKWTGIPYPLKKTDQIAVGQFAAGAMENWGLIVYSEPALLYNPSYSSSDMRRRVADVISHELAHQWFGNIVTMDWWDDTFLNEGFATYMAFYVGIDGINKQWTANTFFMRQSQSIMQMDASAKTPPVVYEGLDQYWELHKAFSGITYNKGAALIRMIRYFLGEATFRKAIQNYLKSHLYGNVVVEDLTDALNKQAFADGKVKWDTSKVNLSMIMDSWLRQINYPLLEVTDLKNGKLSVKQSRFVDDATVATEYPPPSGEFRWYVPFTYADNSTLKRGGYNLEWLYDSSNTVTTNSNSWKLANIYAQGFYRVKYDADTYAAILNQLKNDHRIIPVESRAEIIDDAFNLANAGKFSDADALASTEYLVNETEYLPWYPALRGRAGEYEKLLRRTPTYTHLNNYILGLVIPNYERLGWGLGNKDNYAENNLRLLMVQEACKRKYQPCVLEALKQFQQYVDNLRRSDSEQRSEAVNPIDPDVRHIVYCTAMAHGGPDVWQSLNKVFLTAFNSEDYMAAELNQVIMGMVCVEDPASIDTMLEWAIQFNLSGILELVATRPNIVSTLWDYLDRRWDSFPNGINKLSLVWTMTDFFASESDLKKLDDFIENHPTISSASAKQLRDKVKANKAWVDKNEVQIRNWLRFRTLTNQTNRRNRRSVVDTLRSKQLWSTEVNVKTGNEQYKYWKEDTSKVQFTVKDGALIVETDNSFDSAPVY